MADISISCAICGTMQNVAASCAGQTVRCPVCNSPLKVPGALTPDLASPVAPPPSPAAGGEVPSPGAPVVVAQAAAAESPRLRLTRDRTADGEGRKCPKCDTTMGADDIVCSQCGYNTVTGRSMAEVAAKREAFRRTLAATGAFLIVLAAGVGAWRLGWFEGRKAEAPSPEPASSNIEVAVASTNPPGPPPPPPVEVVDQVRRELKAQQDRFCPQKHEGEQVHIELVSGRMIHGILRAGTKPGTIVVEPDGAPAETIPVVKLKTGSRQQCDPDFRAQELERQVQKRLSL